jgi:hypothetical protein
MNRSAWYAGQSALGDRLPREAATRVESATIEAAVGWNPV